MTTGIPKLPVLKTIARGYTRALGHAGTHAVQASIWAAVYVATRYVLDHVAGRGSPPAAAGLPAAAAYYAALAARECVLVAASTVVALAANRAVISNERPAWRRSLRIARRDLQFLGLTLMLAIAAYGEVFVVYFVMRATGTLASVRAGLASIGPAPAMLLANVAAELLLAITVTPFFGLAFPLAATDRSGGLLRLALRMSRGSRLRLSAISFLARLPFLFAQYVPFLVWTTNPGTTAESLQRAAYTIIGLLGVAFATAGFAVAFVATANRHGEAISDVFN